MIGSNWENFLKNLGIERTVTSPTFVLMKKYSTNFLYFKNIIHIDAYRLQNRAELETLNWSEICSDSENLILIEWPEKVGLISDSNSSELDLILKFHHIDENSRDLEIKSVK
jgi:tRNA threonylcarbamoyl adenosine modification protein YjeE